MRQAKVGGKCSACGKENDHSIFWFSPYKVLDFGTEIGLLENSMKPELCDDCQRRESDSEWQDVFGTPHQAQ